MSMTTSDPVHIQFRDADGMLCGEMFVDRSNPRWKAEIMSFRIQIAKRRGLASYEVDVSYGKEVKA